jgi:hypothetical protein
MEDNKKQDAERIVEDMNKELDLSRAEELIRDNKIIFEYKDKKYRVRLLNLAEKEQLDTLRRKKFGQLMKDNDVLLEKDLIIQYRERGIDINDLDDQNKKFMYEEMDLQIKLGESISKNENETILKTYKEQIEDLREKRKIIYTQKNLLLNFSLENALLSYVASVITYLSIDKLEDGTWKRMFNNLEDFQTYPDEGLINKGASYSMVLQYL